ncbi:hypothetical protein D3C76_1583080 [compost metagenome]
MGDHGQCNPEEGDGFVGAVNLGRLVELGGNLLESGNEQHHVQPQVLQHTGDDNHRHRQIAVIKPGRAGHAY